PFRKWISTLRRRRNSTTLEDSKATHPGFLGAQRPKPNLGVLSWRSRQIGPRESTSTASSSIGFVTAMKSATITLASTSIHPRSWRDARIERLRSGERSSGQSAPEVRKSTDSHTPSLGPIMDEAAWMRSLQRRKVLEELVASEESYIADLKVLVNVYSNLLTSTASISTERRTLIRRNLDQILEIHEGLLGELHHVVPHAEYNQGHAREAMSPSRPRHTRFHSVDILQGRREELPIRKQRYSLDTCKLTERAPIALLADPQTAAKVAAVFNKYVKRFFAYEEYGAKYEALTRELNVSQKITPSWPEYEKGIEALSTALAPMNHRDDVGKKGLTLSDLLIKACHITHWICKYPLLFADLCKQTPVYDDPNSHAEIDKVLFRLRETAREINKATDDPEKRKLIEKTWQLQDRLLFDHQPSGSVILRLLGHVVLCGVLYVAYQHKDGIKGQYMVCVLYKSCLLLAVPHGGFSNFMVKATIALASATLEESDSGKGLQCHSASFSWKLDFESDCRMYEIMFSACSSEEEECWRKPISERIATENQAGSEDKADAVDLLSSLTLDIKSYGAALGYSQSLAKRTSIHRAATLSPKATLSHVIIKNTEAAKEGKSVASEVVNRSHSLLSSSHVPTLSPRRIERIRLERSLSNVWTKELLPYPGMATRRPDHPIRASAQSVMRKLSMASLASNFSKRSASHSTVSQSRWDESRAGTPLSFSSAPSGTRTPGRQRRRKVPKTYEFHNSMAFLPEDFDLQGLQRKSRRMSVAGAIGKGAPVSAWSKPVTTPATPTTPYPDVKIPDFGEPPAQLAKAKPASSKSNDTVAAAVLEATGKQKEQPPSSATITKVSTKLKHQLMKLLKD
ncbi:Dbl homology domain-containing protein, partial [Viridothelium virens]